MQSHLSSEKHLLWCVWFQSFMKEDSPNQSEHDFVDPQYVVLITKQVSKIFHSLFILTSQLHFQNYFYNYQAIISDACLKCPG